MLHGAPASADLTDGTKSLGEFCLRNLRSHGKETLIVDASTDIETSASNFLEQSIQVAKCLQQRGFGPGDRIAICSENRVECCTLMFGTLFIGATCNPISSFFTEVELSHSIRLSKPEIIFVSPATIDKIFNVANENRFIKNVFIFGNDKRCQSFEDFLNNPKIVKEQPFYCEPQNIEDNVALILSSSGTTGPSKGVEVTQANLFAAMDNLPVVDSLIPGPLSYMSGFYSFFLSVARGYKCYLLSKFDPDTYLKCIEKHKFFGIFFNQSMMNFVAQNPLASRYDLSSVVFVFYGGAALSRSNYDSMKEKYPHIILLQGYGSTETGFITNSVFGETPPESVGELAIGLTAKVVDPDTGAILGPLKHGEIRVKSNKVMRGYIGDAEATKNAFDEDGFFCTGDIGYYNDKGEWFIVDRIKELIKYCGMQVYPNEIEAVLMSHPAVQETCVIGFPDEMAGELPLAFVVKKSNVTEKELIDFVASKLSSPQYLRGGVIFIPEMPQQNSGSGKSFRRYLKELAVTKKSKL